MIGNTFEKNLTAAAPLPPPIPSEELKTAKVLEEGGSVSGSQHTSTIMETLKGRRSIKDVFGTLRAGRKNSSRHLQPKQTDADTLATSTKAFLDTGASDWLCSTIHCLLHCGHFSVACINAAHDHIPAEADHPPITETSCNLCWYATVIQRYLATEDTDVLLHVPNLCKLPTQLWTELYRTDQKYDPFDLTRELIEHIHDVAPDLFKEWLQRTAHVGGSDYCHHAVSAHFSAVASIDLSPCKTSKIPVQDALLASDLKRVRDCKNCTQHRVENGPLIICRLENAGGVSWEQLQRGVGRHNLNAILLRKQTEQGLSYSAICLVGDQWVWFSENTPENVRLEDFAVSDVYMLFYVQPADMTVVNCVENARRPQDCKQSPPWRLSIAQNDPTTVINCVIPFFNEEDTRLRTTLNDLWLQEQYFAKKGHPIRFHVLIIQDGWNKADTTMKQYLRELFPPGYEKRDITAPKACKNKTTLNWFYELDNLTRLNTAEDATFVLQRSRDGKAMSEVPLEDGRSMLITAIVKQRNRKKHNSHEWFFGQYGFADTYRSKYLFCTDCATLFEPDCLYLLWREMEHNPKMAACTGRQRVMTREQQGTSETLFTLGTQLRGAQGYDYESSFSTFMGAFAFFGFAPVIPGPCGLYSYDAMTADSKQSPRDWYFEVVNTEPKDTGMALGNLRIAEDRVLSYAPILKAAEEKTLGLVPNATFYFEAELALSQLVKQRRRWINGTVCGYIWLLRNNHLSTAPIPWYRRYPILMLLLMQTLLYAVVALSPALFLSTLYFSLNSWVGEGLEWVVYAIFGICAAVYLGFVYWHHKRASYYQPLWYALWVISTVTIVGAVFQIVLWAQTGAPLNTLRSQVLLGIVIVLLTPVLTALIHSPKSAWIMCKTIIPFYLFLPMLVAWFGAYSFSRLYDLSWGNRPASVDEPLDQAEKKRVEKDLRQKAFGISVMIVLLNIIVMCALIFGAKNDVVVIIAALVAFAPTAVQMYITMAFFAWYTIKRISSAVSNFARQHWLLCCGCGVTCCVVTSLICAFLLLWLQFDIISLNAL